MAKIKGRGNKVTEQRLIEIFHLYSITGWRRGSKLEGKPDFVFPKHRLAVFVDGCFWHGCPKHATQPKSNAEFWQQKLDRNKQRDLEVNRTLKRKGWRVFRIWEHELTNKNRLRLLYRFRQIGLFD